jgi:Glycine/D-amino acid oxidases (deaminating)
MEVKMMENKFDIAVIGAGAEGSATAYFAAKSGAKVILIDAGDLAEGTSSRCDGDILVSDKMPGFDCEFALASQALFPQLAKELDFDFEWRKEGTMYLMETEEETEVAEQYCRNMVACGVPMKMLTAKEVHEDEPNVADDVVSGLRCECDGGVYPIGMVYGYALTARRLGATLLLHSPVTGIEPEGGGFLIRTVKQEVRAAKVVNCCGVKAPKVGMMVGLDIPVEARQGQILVTEHTFPVVKHEFHEFGYMLTKFGNSSYKRNVSERVERNGVAMVIEPTMAGNFLIGSSRSFVGEDISSDIDVMQALAERAIRFFPVLKDIKIIHAYSGVRPFTPDHLPIISDTPVDGYYIAAGHEGDGIGLSAITGKCMAEMLVSGKSEMDISPLSYSRFIKN